MQTYDVIVVGCGAMGSAACWQLARRGARVLGIDQFSLPHDRGASTGHTRMTRTAYYEHPDYVPLLLRAHELWRELEREAGERLLEMTGGLYVGREDSELITGCMRAAREHSLEVEGLSSGELARRFPQFSPEAGSVGVLEKLAGFLYLERCLGAMLHRAVIAGAEVRAGEKVLAVEERAGHVSVRTDRGSYEAGQVVVTTGPWAGRLGVERAVVATRQTLGWFVPREPAQFVMGRIPVWAFDVGGGALLYGFPMSGDRLGLKAAHHAPAVTANPDEVSRQITASDEESLRSLLRRHVPLAGDAPMAAMTTCLYENSPDGHFVVGRCSAGIVAATGFSGHGFKFAPAMGEVLADLATSGTTRHAVDFLRPR